MKTIWWKVYFWLNTALLAFVIIAEFSYPTAPPGLFIADVVIYVLALIGVYAFISRKPFFTTIFWKYFFWFNIVYALVYLVYAIAPDAPGISSLSFLMYGERENLLETALLGTVLSLPYMYAIYRLSKGEFLEYKTKEQELKEAKRFKWGMIQTALWGYSIVFLSLLLLLSLLSSSAAGSAQDSSSDSLFSIVIFAPILIFWLWVAWQYKMYTWNWWRITLLLNSLLFSSIIVFGSFFYDPTAPVETNSEYDIFGILQFFIILTGLFVFGRERFSDKKTVVITASKTPDA
jgi:hypothetical protein